MGICIGGAACRRQDCKERCRAWFGAMPDIEYACRNACKSNTSFTKDEFQCSGNWIDDAIVIRNYGYDPCTTGGTSVQQYLDPLADRAREDQQNTKAFEIAGILGGVALLALLVFLLVIKK